jgi:protein TonB
MGDSKVRIIVSVLLALPVVVGLFMVMHSLIDRDFKNPEVSNQKIADLVQPDEEIQLETNSKKPEKVDMDTNVDNIAPAAAIDISISTSGMSSGDGEYLPIVKVAPIYPRRAQTRGISGYCIVEYTVTTSGAIRDPVAVDCQPSGVFEKASVKASTKFKYKPRVVDGEAIEVAGVQNKFTYELEQ